LPQPRVPVAAPDGQQSASSACSPPEASAWSPPETSTAAAAGESGRSTPSRWSPSRARAAWKEPLTDVPEEVPDPDPREILRLITERAHELEELRSEVFRFHLRMDHCEQGMRTLLEQPGGKGKRPVIVAVGIQSDEVTHVYPMGMDPTNPNRVLVHTVGIPPPPDHPPLPRPLNQHAIWRGRRTPPGRLSPSQLFYASPGKSEGAFVQCQATGGIPVVCVDPDADAGDRRTSATVLVGHRAEVQGRTGSAVG
jgi:hypothetical protein